MLKKTRFTMHFLVITLAALLVSCSDHDHSHDHGNGHSEPNTGTMSSAEAISHAGDTHANQAVHDTDHNEDHDHQESRSATQHTHGDAVLAVVLEGNAVTIELDSPLFNLVGFEHQAETDVQRQVVTETEARLVQGESLFEFNSEAKCFPREPVAPIHLGAQHEDKSEQDHAKEHDEEDDSEHSDVILTYTFDCANPAALTSATVKLFDYFEHMDEIDLVFLGPTTQKHQTLSAANNRANLTR